MRLRSLSIGATLIALASTHALAQQPRSGECDRRCLLSFLTEYTEALTDDNVARLAVATTVRVTSDGQIAALGKGQVWGPARRLPYRQAFVDPLTGAAVFYGVVTTAPRPGRGAARPHRKRAPAHWRVYVAALSIGQRPRTEV